MFPIDHVSYYLLLFWVIIFSFDVGTYGKWLRNTANSSLLLPIRPTAELPSSNTLLPSS